MNIGAISAISKLPEPLLALRGQLLTSSATADSTGQFFVSSSSPRTYGYDGNGNLTTETVTNTSGTFVKTYGYNASNLITSESAWIKQLSSNPTVNFMRGSGRS